MWSIIEYLKDPYLVLKVQKFYGVHEIEPLPSDLNSVSNLGKTSTLKSKTLCSDVSAKKSNDDCVTEPKQNGLVLRVSKSSYNSDNEDVISSDSETESKNYVITNWFWYYLFIFGTELGDEIFYATFIPFWFWNIDGAVGRRVVMVWTIIMYIGQGAKDIICWPRPASPPVFRLQKKWAQEYGMPSTHAMVGISIPFSVVLFTINRYQYPLIIGLLIATSWCTIMCISRIYLGMHSVLDIVAGLLLALILMIPVIPLVDSLDHLILTSKWSPPFLIIISLLLIKSYPKGKGEWTPTRGDTVLIVSVCVGVLIGAWANYQLGEMKEPTSPPPYSVIWPSYEMLGLGVLRTVIGLCCVVGTRAFCKSIMYAVIYYVTTIRTTSAHVGADSKCKNPKDQTGSNINGSNCNVIADLCHKYVTYMVLGFTILYLFPSVFRMLRIERPTFYTEI